MRAIVIKAHGGPDVLEIADRSIGSPGSGEVVVDVAAAGVNFMDIYVREGRPPYARDLPVVPGSEGAGVVSAVGGNVEGVSVGDHVAWTGVPGSYAEQIIAPVGQCVPVPDGVSLETAAAVMLQGCTAHYLATSTHPIRSGDVAVVHAAAGGVGLLLTQIAVARGAVVVATTSTGAKAELARGAGAHHVAGYEDFVNVVRDVTGDGGADVVYDGIGRSTFDDSLRAVRRRGLMVLYGGASGPVPPLELQRLAGEGSIFITRPTLGDYLATREELVSRTNDLFGWIADGRLDVRIGGRYDLGDAAKAHEDLASRATTGKLILTTG